MNELWVIYLKQVILAIIFLLSFYGWGVILSNILKIKYSNDFEGFYINVSIGMVLFIGYIILLGIFNLIYDVSVFIFIAGILGVFLNRLKLTNIGWIIFLFVLMIPCIYFTLYPPTKWDDISFHLPIAQSLLSQHHFVVNEFIRYPFFPMNGEILFVMGLSFSNIAPQLIPWICVFLLVIICFEQIRVYFNSIVAAILSSLLLLSNSIIIYLGTVSYIDLILALFVTLSITCFWKYLSDRGIYFLYLSGIFLGTAVGIKYTAAIFCILLGLILLIMKRWRHFSVYTVTVILFGSIWYLRNAYYAYNPVWPFLSSLFGEGIFWNNNDYIGQFSDFSSSGTEKNGINFLKIPWIMLKSHEGYGLDYLVWLGILVFFITKFNTQKKYLVFIWLSFTVFWFFSVNLVRYYMPIIPVMCLISAIGFYYLIKQMADNRLKISAIILIMSCFLYSYYGTLKFKATSLAAPPVNAEETNAFLEGSLPTYKATKLVASLDGRTYGLLNENLYFYGNEKIIGDWFGPARYSDIFDVLNDSSGLLRKLRALDVDYFLINKTRLSADLKANLNLSSDPNFKNIYEDEAAVVYSLKKKGAQAK